MTRMSTYFLQAVLIFIGIVALAFLIWEPNVEGVNAHATTFSEIYLDDPFLVYAYTASIAFFVALYQAFTVLTSIRKNTAFSLHSVRAFRTIQYCAIALVGFIAAPLAYLFIARPGDDIAGGVAMGLFILCISVVVTAAATVCERVVHSAVDKK
ncbi:MAG: DUF2975 domain-containing protein [Candidatus Peribacteraceae bacterium]|nr:DUF2975 domain-containing protein [Candidatus Peribacteraceae bacterium]